MLLQWRATSNDNDMIKTIFGEQFCTCLALEVGELHTSVLTTAQNINSIEYSLTRKATRLCNTHLYITWHSVASK